MTSIDSVTLEVPDPTAAEAIPAPSARRRCRRMLLVDIRLVMPTGLPRPADKPLLDIYASIVVDRDSQKGIVSAIAQPAP